VGCDVDVKDSPPLVVDDEPYVEKPKGGGGNYEEIHRGNAVLVVAEKRHPALLLPFVTGLYWHVPRNCCEADREAELPEFRVNLSSAPTILCGEASDQLLNFCR